MKLSGWGALACAAVFAIGCDTTPRESADLDESPAASARDDSIGIDRDDAGEPELTQGTSGQARTTANDARSFAEKALMANHAEVKLGELAAQRAQNADVKDFAQMMIRDHTKAANELEQAMKGQNVTAPSSLDAKHQALYDRLSKLKGAEFDREYMSAMVDGHKEVRDMVDDRADNSPSATGTTGQASGNAAAETAVNQWARKTLPAVEQHLKRAQEIQGRLK